MSVEPTDVSLPLRKVEDTSAGCRLLANDDRIRAGQSTSDHMRARLSNSADTWTERADLLERLEARRVPIESAAPGPGGEDDDG